MGGGCLCMDKTKVLKNKSIRSNYQIVIIPNSEKVKLIPFDENKEKLSLVELMNKICFDSKYSTELDANFISKFNKDIDDYDYFIQRLDGCEIKEDNSMRKAKWNVYINEIKEEWSHICRHNRMISKQDNIELKYETVDN